MELVCISYTIPKPPHKHPLPISICSLKEKHASTHKHLNLYSIASVVASSYFIKRVVVKRSKHSCCFKNHTKQNWGQKGRWPPSISPSGYNPDSCYADIKHIYLTLTLSLLSRCDKRNSLLCICTYSLNDILSFPMVPVVVHIPMNIKTLWLTYWYWDRKI